MTGSYKQVTLDQYETQMVVNTSGKGIIDNINQLTYWTQTIYKN